MSGNDVSSRDIEADILQRLATLEERTRPKRKTLVEFIQMYGGLAALVITIGYSWPLGVWDRFILDPRQATERELTELRESLDRATTLTIELGKVQSSITNPELRDLAARSIANQLLLLVSAHDAEYSRYQEKLNPEELLIVGIMYQNLYRIEDSLRYFEYVAQHPKASEIMLLEANRQIAKSYFFPSPIRDISKARGIYQRILSPAMQSPRMEIVLEAITIQSEWGYLEMTTGDWMCGLHNWDEALEKLASLQPIINDQGNTVKFLTAKRQSVSLQPGQPQNGC